MKILKCLVLFVCILFLITGCREDTGIDIPDISSLPPKPTLDVPVSQEHQELDKIEMKGLSFIQLFTGKEYRYNNLIGWHEYIIKKFGIELNVSYKEKENRIGFLSYYGMGYSQQPNTEILRYVVPNSAHDLMPYYEEYGWGQYISDDIIEKVTLEGKLTVLPVMISEYVRPRFYNKEYLDTLQMEVPNNTAEFREYLIGAKELNKREGHFYPICFPNQYFYQATADIFRAYDVYVNSEMDSSVAFNPNTGTFEDGVFAEDFETALMYIRDLQMQDLLGIIGHSSEGRNSSDYVNRFESSILELNRNFASEYFCPLGNTSFVPGRQPKYDYSEGYALYGTNSSNIVEIKKNLGFYIFPDTIGNIDSVVELFNYVMTDPGFSPDIKYGINGDDYTEVNGIIVAERPSWDGCINLYPLNFKSAESETFGELYRSFGDDMIYVNDVFSNIMTYTDSTDLAKILIDGLGESLLYEDIPPTEAISRYKSDFRKIGLLDIIIDMNEKLGTVPEYDYIN